MDGAPPPEEDFSTLPLSERLNHKNWKARVNGYESLIKSFQSTASESDPVFRPFISNPDSLKKMVTDANAVAQEKAVETVVQFVRYAGENAIGTRESVLPSVVDKCFGSTRSGTKSHALELVLQYVEVCNGGAAVLADVLVGLNAKQPKTVVGTVMALKEIVKQVILLCFGTAVVPPPPILKQLPKMFAHTDKTVRSESVLLVQHLYRNVGEALEPWLADLKPVQIKELNESFETMDKEGNGKGTFKPERLTRAQQQQGDENENESGVPETAPEELDPRKFAEEVDITGDIPASFHTALSSSKWKERKEALDELSSLLARTPRIKDSSEFGNICKDLAGRMADANINCVIVAANCIETLAKGLGSNFAKHKDIVVKPMLERLKERKQSVADALGSALDALFSTINLADVIEDVIPVLETKNPQVKEGTLKFINRCLSNSENPPLPNQIKPLSESLANLLEDSFEGARNEAAVGLGTLMKIVGERPLNPIMEPMADVRKVKVKEAFEKAIVRCKKGNVKKPMPPPVVKVVSTEKKTTKPPASTGQPPTPAARPTSPSIDELPSDAVSKPKPRGPPARLLAKKKDMPVAEASKPAASAPVKKAAPPNGVKAAKMPKPAIPSELDTFKFRHTLEEAEVLATELLPTQIVSDFGDSNWKLRLAALEELHTWLGGKVSDVDSEILFRFFSKRGWSEKNFQVSAKLYGILSLLAEQSPGFGRSCVALATGHLIDKLGDMKLKKPAGDLLLLFAEKTSLHFVLTQGYEVMEKQKAPKVLADSVAWVNSALIEFGISGLSLRNLIEFLKVALKHSNAAVRSSGTRTLVTVKLFAGSVIKDFLEDLNSQLLATIQSEFDKVEGQSAPTPCRTSADLANIASTSASGTADGPDPLDDLFPRVELDRLLAGTTILVDAKSDAWKVRKEALETLQSILDVGQNKRLKPSMGEIAQVLKSRVTDTNKACQLLALDILSRIASGMNKPFEKHVKHFAVAVASVLADQKANIRAAAVSTLTDIATACEGVDPLVPGLVTNLETPNPLLRSSLMTWLAQWLTDNPPKHRLDLSSMVGQVVATLDDRSADVRKGAQNLIPHLIANIGYERVAAETNNLKPASRNAVLPLLQNLRPTAAVKSAPDTSSAPQSAVTPTETVEPNLKAPVPAPSAGSISRLNNLRGRRIAGLTSTKRARSESQVEDSIPQSTNATSVAAPTHHISSQSSDMPPCPFIGSNLEVKKTRLGKDINRWVIDGSPVRKELAELLHTQMDGRLSPHLLNLLFSNDHNAINDFVTGMGVMVDCYNNASTPNGKSVLGSTKAILLANDDLALKYACLKLHEPQSNLVGKCMDVIEAVVTFLKFCDHQLNDTEAACFVPTLIHKLGDGRESIRIRAQALLQSLPRIYAYSRIFALLLDHGLKAKVAKTRQGALEELGSILKKAGVGACDPPRSFPVIGKMLSDKDPTVRKAALNVFSEAYPLLGDKIWIAIGNLPSKDKTQLEERLKRVPGASSQEDPQDAPMNLRQRAITSNIRSASPSKLAGPRTASPTPLGRVASPHLSSIARPAATGPVAVSHIPGKKAHLPSRLARPSSRQTFTKDFIEEPEQERRILRPLNIINPRPVGAADILPEAGPSSNVRERRSSPENNDIGLMISNILSNDPTRSVEALKKVQKVLEPESGPGMPLSQSFQDIAEHSEGLIETITVQVSHVFDRVDELHDSATFRLAKHLMQTLHSFFTHTLLAESLTMDAIMTLLEELTLRLLQTDESADSNVKEISRFINLIILKIFATARRISVFRALFALLLKIVRPFPASRIQPEAQEAKVAELVLKCIWKLARNIPSDLDKECLDPVEVFPAIEHSLQSIPPNDWRARAANKVPCGDMPLRTIKVIIQHIVAKYGERVYDILSHAFDDPSATIVYPYVYRILNSSTRAGASHGVDVTEPSPRSSLEPPAGSRPGSETSSQVNGHRHSSDSPPTRNSVPSTTNGHHSPVTNDDDPDAQLISIIHNISSETTGALHKEGITELHRFLKAYPHKKAKVDKLLEATGPAFRKYLARALASRAAEDEDRDAAVADTLSRLEAVRGSNVISSPVQSPRRSSGASGSMEVTVANAEKLSRLHDIFHYRASDTSSREFRSSNEFRNSPDT